jgi:hypothetical protein
MYPNGDFEGAGIEELGEPAVRFDAQTSRSGPLRLTGSTLLPPICGVGV